jgi:pimeloyl-ACP methyl ester carboxylesterase
MTMDEAQFSEPTRRWQALGRHVDVDGLRLFVYERGAGPAILFLHGFPTCCYDWRGVIDGLADGYRCVAMDFPGYGLSDKPAAYSYSLFQQTDALEGLASALGVAEAHVVSHDVGVSVHTELLAREQEGRGTFSILSSTFLNGSTLQELATITQFQKLLGSNETLPQGIEICNAMAVNYAAGLRGVMKRPEALTHEDATVLTEVLMFQDGNRRLPAIAGYMRERYIHRDRWVGAMKNARARLQIIWADGDPVANLEMGRALRDQVGPARYTEVPGLGHFLLMEDPPLVARRIREFIGSL